MIKRIFLLGWAVLLTVGVYSQMVSLTPIRDLNNPVFPGQHLTLSYRISNNSGEKLTTNCQVELPEKWICICQDSLLTLDANTSDTRLMTILLPLRTRPGIFEVRYKVFSTNGTLLTTALQKISVRSVVKVNVELLDAPTYAIAGTKATATFLVKNLGNTSKEITLQPINCELESKSTFTLSADSSVHVKVFVNTDPFTAFHNLYSFTLKAIQVDPLSNETTELSYKTAQFQVVPSFEKESDAYFRFPVNIGIFYLGVQSGTESMQNALQYDISGAGNLAPGKSGFLEFKLRGPDRFYLSSIGMYEEYYAKFRSKNFSAIVGDNSYRLTPLTEENRYGRGFQAVLEKSKFAYGAFYTQPRFSPDVKEESAVFVEYKPLPKTSVKVAALSKVPANEFKTATIFTVEANSELNNNLSLSAEISSGEQGGKTGNASMLGISGSFKHINFSTSGIYSDKYYAGYYKDTRYYYATVNSNLTKKFGLNLTYSHDDRNPDKDTLYGMSPTSDYLLGGFSYNYAGRSYFSLLSGYNERSDRMELNTFHYIDLTNRLTVQQFYKENFLSVEGELASTNNLITNTKGESWSTNASLNVFVTRNLWIEAMGGYYSTYRYTANRNNTWLYGGGFKYNYEQKLIIDGRIQNNYSPEDYYLDRNLLNLNVSYRPNFHHEFSMMARKTLLRKQISQEDMAFSIGYILHLGVPVKKIKQTGSVSGRIVNMGVDTVAGIIVKLDGHTTVTDKNGNFRFSNVRPDTYFLIIDPATTDVNNIPDRKTPITVVVDPDKDIRVEFGLTKGASIEGKLIFKKENNGGNSMHEQNEKRPQEILIEITNGAETYRKLIDKEGRYAFINVRPGKWKVKAYSGDDMGAYSFEKNEYSVELRAGQKSEINIPLGKKQKKIIFQDEPIKVEYR